MKTLIFILVNVAAGIGAWKIPPPFANCPDTSKVMGRNITRLHFVAQVKVVDEQERNFDNEDHLRYTVELETFFHRPYKNRKEWLSPIYNPRTINILENKNGRRACDVTLDIGESYIVIGSMGEYELIKRWEDMTFVEKLYLMHLADQQPKFD